MAFKLVARASGREQPLKQFSVRQSFEGDRSINLKETHIAILKMGVSIWNCWRSQAPLKTPLLVNADLTGLALENVNLCGANLSGANLSGCYLYDADFQGANLRWANLSRAGLIGANFHRADLSGANLSQAYLAQSDLSNASLVETCLKEADLQSALVTGAIFTKANLAKTAMTDCFDLTLAQLQSAQNAHLAFCPEGLGVQLKQNGQPTRDFEPVAQLRKAPSASPKSASLQWAGANV